MKLFSYIRRRRFRRLSLAMVAALMVHLGLVVSGDWRMGLISVPSSEDRVITMSLEQADIEGAKEPVQAVQETINTPNIAKPRQLEQPQPQPIKEQTPVRKPTVGPVAANTDPEPSELTQSQTQVKPIEQADTIEQAKPAEHVEYADRIKPDVDRLNEVLSEAVAVMDQPVATPSAQEASLLDVITTNRPEQALVLPEAAITFDAETSEHDGAPLPAAAAQIEPKQRDLIEKKVLRILDKLDHVADLPNSVNWQKRGQEYRASFEYLPASHNMGIDEVRVEVATEKDGTHLTTTLRVKKLVFSNFAQFVDHWDEGTAIHDDEMDGRFHSNTEITFASDREARPVFHGKVTTAAFTVNKQGHFSSKKTFLGGLETRVKRIRMPKARSLFNESETAQLNTIVIQQDSSLRFTEDGHFLQQPLKQVAPPQLHKMGDQPVYIIAAEKVSLRVSGTVNGLVTVFSPKRITIDGDIRYADRGPVSSGGDFLGLVSGLNVMIAKRNVVGEGDLHIDASIYARSRFGVNGIRGKRSGVLKLFGSLSVGTLTATEPRYATDIVFDPRLENLRPPGFPVTDRYEMLAQDYQWQVSNSPFHDMQETDELVQAIEP